MLHGVYEYIKKKQNGGLAVIRRIGQVQYLASSFTNVALARGSLGIIRICSP